MLDSEGDSFLLNDCIQKVISKYQFYTKKFQRELRGKSMVGYKDILTRVTDDC